MAVELKDAAINSTDMRTVSGCTVSRENDQADLNVRSSRTTNGEMKGIRVRRVVVSAVAFDWEWKDEIKRQDKRRTSLRPTSPNPAVRLQEFTGDASGVSDDQRGDRAHRGEGS